MADQKESSERDGLAAALRNLTEGLSDLVRQHLTWLRLELQREASEAGRHGGYLAVFGAIAVLGYLWLSVTLVLLVGAVVGAIFTPSSGLLGMGVATFVLGFVHLGVGGYYARTQLEALQEQQRRLQDINDPLIENESWAQETMETAEENSSPETIEENSPNSAR